MSPLSVLRFFAAVAAPAPPLVVVFGVLAAGGGALEIVDRGSSDWVLAAIALIQLFSVSTGFTRHASRGYFDPVLTASGRIRVALAHFAVSSAPGVAAWIAVGIAQSLAAASLGVPAFRAAGWTALLLTSAVPWAAGIRTAPYAGGGLWLLVSTASLLAGKTFHRLALLHANPDWGSDHPVAALVTGLAFPYAIPSLSWPAVVLIGFVGVAAAAAAAGVAFIVRAEFPLTEEGP